MGFDLKKCSKEELENIKTVISNSELQELINVELASRNNDFDYIIKRQYSSERLPNYAEEYSILCNQILLEYDVRKFKFLLYEGFFGTGNNKIGDFNQPVCGFTNTKFDKKWNCNLGYLSLVFCNEKFKKNYEGAYNTLNYTINCIYKEINDRGGVIQCKEDLFTDISLRKEAVKDNFTKIVDELWQLRGSIIDSRLSVGNHGLLRNRYKSGKKFSTSQKLLIEAIAYGCSLNELNDCNYEGAKRLIYVPRDKITLKK